MFETSEVGMGEPQLAQERPEPRRQFSPDEIVTGPELEAVVKEGLVEFRGLLDSDDDVAWARKSLPEDKAIPNMHNNVVKNGVAYKFRDGPYVDTKTGEALGVGVHILRLESGNEEEIRVLEWVGGKDPTVLSRLVFTPEQQPGTSVGYSRERGRGKLASLGGLFGRGKHKPDNYVIDRDYIPINSGLAINNMLELIGKTKADFTTGTQIPNNPAQPKVEQA